MDQYNVKVNVTLWWFLIGTDEAAVIEVLARRSIAQRQRIKEVYKQTVGKVSVLLTYACLITFLISPFELSDYSQNLSKSKHHQLQ